jgi:hypothetical protein
MWGYVYITWRINYKKVYRKNVCVLEGSSHSFEMWFAIRKYIIQTEYLQVLVGYFTAQKSQYEEVSSKYNSSNMNLYIPQY